MAVETYLEQLERVQTLIAQIETTGGYVQTQIGDTMVKYPDPEKLYTRERELRALVAEEATSGADAPIRARRISPIH